MGYTKIVQFGDVTEIYEYEKTLNIPPSHLRKRCLSSTRQKRNKEVLRLQKEKGTYTRSKRSIKRSRDNFFRLVHHNNCRASTIHFLTITFAYDVTYKKAARYVSHFLERLKKHFSTVPISYISVPELTKKNRLHFHLLVYDLPSEASISERKTRNIQRFFRRGYIDISLASYTSKGLAGYLSKYLGKSLVDFKNETTRGYSCSRNIDKIRSASGNSLSGYADLFIPTYGHVQSGSYDVPFLGKCHYKKITKIKNES